ncbi:MAG: carbamoyl-phosphate synthase (glutamine-hydrolyzing) large subunit [SAR324 cluster bacterium]|nr:carbamoyl-phosphate synthase (glutamine-hydrolyzing) large subunit [SAR324 cluster bacterium]
MTIKKVLVFGSAALKIGEAGEFDYSGSQAIKALKSEGIKTSLVNPNIATVQTDQQLADKIYFLPVTPTFIEKIIAKERPDGVLLSCGGQTALNCGIDLAKNGVFDKYGVKVLGTPIKTIVNTEDRALFAEKLNEIGVLTPNNRSITSLKEAISAAKEVGYPVMIRIAYALGGLGSTVVKSEKELIPAIKLALSHSHQVLIEEYLLGWKEIEYEVVRDSYDNCITVCNMENLDPLGIHTGESIVVAPSQTLSNEEYHFLREIAIKTIRHLGVVGECNIQYALDPHSKDYRVIEVNARLSRSSALASKATGYPLAYVSVKLALGYSLGEITNNTTKATMACFEPALDYIVIKIPRWDLKKFPMVSKQINSSMKSVGEVMAIGRCFEEALQKALRMLDIGALGIVGNKKLFTDNTETKNKLEKALAQPTDERIFALAKALVEGFSIDEIHQLTHIDRWYLSKIQNIISTTKRLDLYKGGTCPRELLLLSKKLGFADAQLAHILDSDENKIRLNRINFGIHPYVKQIDTLAGEYPPQTNYLYLTYHASQDDLSFHSGNNKILILGSGAYRIGSSVEFDWCCVNSINTIKELGYETLMLNFNPETVSTDYDISDRLYFDEISLETVLEILRKESAMGVIVSVGGQAANNLALPLHLAGVNVLGTSPIQIDRAEDRKKFSAALDQLKIDQPKWCELTDLAGAIKFCHQVGYPTLVRPSYVLSGAAMIVASNDREMTHYFSKVALVSNDHPVVISKFIEDAKEIELDAVAFNGEITAFAISEHVENAGVHSGDATLVYPAQRTYVETMRQIIKIGRKIAKEFAISGPFNTQFVAKSNFIKVIECNLRASRSFPFISKVAKLNFIKEATLAIMGKEATKKVSSSFTNYDYVGVKASQFSFTRLNGADPTLGVEMSSTGEVACLGDDFNEALLKSLISVGFKFPLRKVLLSTGPLDKKIAFNSSVQKMILAGIEIYSTPGTYKFLKDHQLKSKMIDWPDSTNSKTVLDLIYSNQLDLVINIPKNFYKQELDNDYLIRRKAVDRGIPLVTNIQLAKRLVEAALEKTIDDLQIKDWHSYK